MTNQTVARVQRVVWDVVLTIILLVATLAILLASAFFDFIAVAFTDYCPEPCHAGAGVAVVFTVWVCMAVIALIGIIVSIIRLVRGRRAWWIALIALGLIIVGSVAAFWLYATIVSY
jgi:hypothetical protein